jgi:hypothetical protein
VAVDMTSLPPYLATLARRDPAGLDDTAIRLRNRGLLDLALGGAIRPRSPSVVERAPPGMLADPYYGRGRALDGFLNPTEDLAGGDVPWGAWRRSLIFWVPLVLTLSVAVIALGAVLHRQWASHEHLPYPTIELARAVLPEQGGWLAGVFSSRLFWIGFVTLVVYHLNNYAATWWPDSMIRIPNRFDVKGLMELLPLFKDGPNWGLFTPTFWPIIVALAFFLASDVSLSLGVSPYLYCAGVALAGYRGITIDSDFINPSTHSSLNAGGYLAVFLGLLYTGRHYYASALRRGLGLSARDKIEPHAVWGSRVFLGATVLFVVQLMLIGVEWQLAALYTLGAIVIFVVISRLVAEAGALFLHAYFFPCAMIWVFLGAKSAGPEQMLALGIVSSLFLIDPREAMMPFAVCGMRLVDSVGLRIGRVATWGVIAFVVGLGVAIPVTLYLQYRHGAFAAGDGWTTSAVPSYVFNANSRMRTRLESQGQLEAAKDISGWERFAKPSPLNKQLGAFAIVFGLATLFMFLRRRFAWWPLHPVLFLVLGTYQAYVMCTSFLLGWLIKTLVMKYGGGRLYNRLKPLMIGIIAGEMMGLGVSTVINILYYLITGDAPKAYRGLPA